ncbi:MAG: hypothetical protein GX659_07400 [Myxococcales bacterium]|nr:hypothetical protein [Myxococcales bacterium]
MKKKAVIALISAPLLFLAMIFALLIAVLNWPTIIINPYSLSALSKYLIPLGIHVGWSDMKVSTVSSGFLDETVSIKVENICIKMKPEIEHGCFSDVGISFRYEFKGMIPNLKEIGPLSMTGGDIYVVLADDVEDESTDGEIFIPDVRIPGYFSDVSILPVRISVESTKVDYYGGSVSGSVDINADSSNQNTIDRISLSFRLNSDALGRFDGTIAAHSASSFRKGDWSASVNLSGNLDGGGIVSSSIDLSTDDGKELGVEVNADYSEGILAASSKIDATISSKSVNALLNGNMKGVSDVIPEVRFSGCRLDFKSSDKSGNRGLFDFKCLTSARLKRNKLPCDAEVIYRPPEDIDLDISANGESFFIPDLDVITKGSLSAVVRPHKGKLVYMSGHLSSAFEGVPSEGVKGWKFQTEADLDFTIKNFAELVSVLEKTSWPVPAPFNVLDGSVEFSVEGKMSSESDKIILPAKLRSRLESAKQKIFLDSAGKLEIGFKGDASGKAALDMNVDFDDVQIQLPDLALASIPRLVPDSRIITGGGLGNLSGDMSESYDFEYSISLRTVSGKPIRILSNLTPEFIPIALDMNTNDERLSGSFKIESFPVKLFSRSANLDYLDIELADPSEKSVVKGKFVIPYIDMKILVEIAGTIEQPSIVLASEPPMSEGDILSMLLYGEPLNDLDSDNASSVSNTNMAIAERSMALTSFLLLASTPIQSVAYNPDTKTFSARVRLANKTSLTVGSSGDQKEVGIKQRLGKGWSITTNLEKHDTSPGAASAYIEWSKRY